MLDLNKLTNPLKNTDPVIYVEIEKELERQKNSLELIASENFVSPAIMAAVGSCLTNKYAEGYPGKRYYGGCEHIDVIEQLAIDRVKTLFGADHANVQPHSGAQANMAAYQALLQPGDTILGMSLDNGGHLTHGSPVNQSGKLYNFIPYGVTNSGFIDYNEIDRLCAEHQPKLVLAGASAYPRAIDFERIGEIARKYNAYFMVDMAHIAGLIVGGLHQNPVPFADIVTTTTHKTLRGPRGGVILCKKEFAKKVDSAVFPGMQGGPLEHVIAGKAVCFLEASSEDFKNYQRQVVQNTKVLASELMARGISLVSGGTDNHLMLVDLSSSYLTGKAAQEIFEEIGITLNKNMIPNDPATPMVTSGVRIGTPAVTTRGLVEEDMVVLAYVIATVIKEPNFDKEKMQEIVKSICEKHPLY